jgi:hypothetical protein
MTSGLSLAIRDWLSADGLEIAAIALSPLIALRISAKLERNRDEDNRKLWVLQTLMATRHAPFADDRIRALNMIDVLFRNDDAVRSARRELLASLSKTEGVSPDGTLDKKLSAKALNAALMRQALMDETNKSLIMFARKDLGLRWQPSALFQYPAGAGVIGEYKEPEAPAERGGERSPAADDAPTTSD